MSAAEVAFRLPNKKTPPEAFKARLRNLWPDELVGAMVSFSVRGEIEVPTVALVVSGRTSYLACYK